LGVSSNFRAWGEDATIYIARGRGPRLWDIDGNEYVDYRLGYGPTILGYADARVDAAAREGIEIGGISALSTEREFAVADRIARMVESVDLVRFANSGTEAVMGALRLARAYSGKESHIMVEGCFHGLFDGALWEVKPEENEAGEIVLKVSSDGKGVPSVLRDLVHMVPLNDANRLEDTLKKHGDEIGAMLIEPMMGNASSISSTPEYLHAVRELCTRHDVVLIIDEVKTGFRVARGGVQELLGVRADLCTFAKAMGNGYPISAIGGREEIMRHIGPHGSAQGGTYAAHPVSLAAADKTLEILDESDALEGIARYGTAMQESIGKLLDDRSIAHVFSGHPSMGGLFFTDSMPQNYSDWAHSNTGFYNELAARLNALGILCEPDSREPWFLSAAHDDACLQETLEKFEIALDETIDA
jgi:glutamate-1-semialdehyde 2,1-aminomutase